jgi:hypothetical protein
MISDLDINNIITIVVAKYEIELESIKGYKELDDALNSRWKFENLENLCRKWIEQEIKISQIKFLLQMHYYDESQEYALSDYNIVSCLFDRIIAKKLKTIQVDIKLKSLESDFD